MIKQAFLLVWWFAIADQLKAVLSSTKAGPQRHGTHYCCERVLAIGVLPNFPVFGSDMVFAVVANSTTVQLRHSARIAGPLRPISFDSTTPLNLDTIMPDFSQFP